MTKAQKRKLKEKDKGIVGFIMLLQHFWKDLNIWVNEMTDPRNPSYISYTQADLFFMGILKNVCAQKSMREMDENFNTGVCIDTLAWMSGDRNLKEMPHYDTLNYYLERLSPQCLAGLRVKMLASLIRSKQFYRNRLLGKYWRIVLDGTQLFCFKEKHCENCLRTTYTTKDGGKETYYYHRVLEAKIILGDKLVISLDTEFIENEKEDAEKQDCEINAAKRLLGRLKKTYPPAASMYPGGLPVCGGANHETMQGKWLEIYFHPESREAENSSRKLWVDRSRRWKNRGQKYLPGKRDRGIYQPCGRSCGKNRSNEFI